MDYKNGRIYQILNTVNKDVYVGSTCQALSKRMAWHRQAIHGKADQNRPLYQKMQEIGIEHFYIELLEEFPSEGKEQLRKREGHYIREIGTLNSRKEGRTTKQYYEDNYNKIRQLQNQYRESNQDSIRVAKKQYREINKDKIKELDHQYYEQNKDRIKEVNNLYREENKDKIKEINNHYREANKERLNAASSVKITCECGSVYRKSNKGKHLRTEKHTDWLSLQTESIEL